MALLKKKSKVLNSLLSSFVSFFIFLFLFPVILLICIVALAIQGRPIFFIHERLGKNCKPFMLIKFRTMKDGPSISAKNDVERITKLGSFLRLTSLDELPTLVNVIKGDISFVGPRPMPIKYLSRFSKKQLKRFKVKPGITGLAQINGRNNLSWEQKFDFDLQYVDGKNLRLDFSIFFKTILIVLKMSGVKTKNSDIMPEFMGTENDDIE